jgi:biopolymer transport protein ExbD
MKVRHSTSSGGEKIELQMAPLIDIVFQLLTFFIMTFKIGAQEGDFFVKMPLASQTPGPPSEIAMPPITIRLLADPRGGLAGVLINDRALAGRNPMDSLRLEIISLLGDDRGPGSYQESAEVELDCDYNLNYEHTIGAITAVSGYLDDSGNIVKLVEKIKFANPRPPNSG